MWGARCNDKSKVCVAVILDDSSVNKRSFPLLKLDTASLSVKLNLSLLTSLNTKIYSAQHQEYQTLHVHNRLSSHHGVFQSTVEMKWKFRFNKYWNEV